MEKVKCVEYRGVRNLVAAEVITDTIEKFECGTPFHVAWVSELSKETEASNETKYYDNSPAIVINGMGADTVSTNTSVIPLDVLAKLTGQFYEEETGMFLEGEQEDKYYAIGYITEDTAGNEVYVWRLKTKAQIPSETHGTKNDGTDSNGQSLVFNCVQTIHKFEKRGKSERAVTIPASKYTKGEDVFFGTVQTPDTITASN